MQSKFEYPRNVLNTNDVAIVFAIRGILGVTTGAGPQNHTLIPYGMYTPTFPARDDFCFVYCCTAAEFQLIIGGRELHVM